MGLVFRLHEAGAGLGGSTQSKLLCSRWEEEPAVQSDWRDQNPHSPSLGVQRKEDECRMGHPESFLEEGMGLAGKI